MTDLRQAAQQALEALNRLYNDSEIMVTHDQHRAMKAAITALRAALAEPQTTHWEGCEAVHPECKATPRRPLTDEEMRECAQAMNAEPLAEGWPELIKFARALERAHGIGGGE